MRKVEIPEDFLEHINLGACSYDSESCISPEGEISDFNVWDRFLDDEEVVQWTTCKLVLTIRVFLYHVINLGLTQAPL